MRPVWIARPLWAPRVVHRPRNLEGILNLCIVTPHLTPIEGPICSVTELRTRLEPFGPKAERHHGKMHRRATDRFAGIVSAELNRVITIDDAFIGPVEFRLMMLIRSEILKRSPIKPGIEGDD